ncbi:MAG: DUF6115 domain-containing protein [Eubacteriales bacterium]|nr:DUF6115 domain-containing protein [Eubacteriales bacterium]
MIWLEIGMILIGMGAIIYSVRLADSPRRENETTKKAMHVIDVDTAEQMEQQLADYQQKVENIAAETELQTGDKMKDLSNESILGISEYSDQVLDKIEKNHAEVVFLYNMLNEKQEELKGIIKDADKMKAELRDELSVLYQENQEWIQDVKAELQEAVEHSVAVMRDAVAESTADVEKTVEAKEEEELSEWEEIQSEERNVPDAGYEEVDGFVRKDEILDLYKKGHSVLEISKLLSLGQGEVKFVIDVYGKK